MSPLGQAEWLGTGEPLAMNDELLGSTSPKAAPDAKSVRTRRRILRAAAEVIAAKGYASTSLADIAREAELKVGSLYYHFAAKDDLVLEVVETGTKAVHDRVESVLQNSTGAAPSVRIALAIEAHLAAIHDEGSHTRANLRSYGQLPPRLAQAHLDVERSYGVLWRDLLDEAIAAGEIRSDLDPAAMRLLLIGAMNWSIEWFDSEGALTKSELSRQCSQMILDGMRVSR